MMVIFDIEIGNWDIVMTCSDEEFIVMEEMRTFVESRIRVLETEINIEEQSDKTSKATVIYLRESRLQPRGYSEPLCDKILSCFSEQDVQFMWKKVEQALQRFLN